MKTLLTCIAIIGSFHAAFYAHKGLQRSQAACDEQPGPKAPPVPDPVTTHADRLFRFKPRSGNVIARTSAFAYHHEGRTRQARWVVERLTADRLKQNVPRKDSFRPDKMFPVEFRATLKDYLASGYDRGHLAPSANYRLNAEDQRATFLLSNMSPQKPRFNRGIWKKLEAHVRDLASKPGVELFCVTCPLWIPDADGMIHVKTIGKNNVWVPTHCGKACCIKSGGKTTLIAWILPNADSDKPLESFRVSTDEFERRAGIDVWAVLPDAIEDKLEAKK